MVKVRGLSPLVRFEPLPAVNENYFMHKMCQIPHPHRRLHPMSPLLDLATNYCQGDVL